MRMRWRIFQLISSDWSQTLGLLRYWLRQITALPGDEFHDPRRMATLVVVESKPTHMVVVAESYICDGWRQRYTVRRRSYFGTWL